MNIMTLRQNGFKSTVKFGLLALIVAAAPAISRADVIYSNYGGGLGYNFSVGNEVGGDGVGDNQAQADTFTPTATYTFTSLTMALGCYGSCPDNFTVAIMGDVGGFPNSASVLDSFTFSGTALPTFGTGASVIISGGPALTLNAGTPYWIAVMTDTTNQIDWGLNSTGDASALATAFGGGGVGDTWYELGGTPGAYEIDGTLSGSTPEPGTLGMILGGGLLLGFLRKVRS